MSYAQAIVVMLAVFGFAYYLGYLAGQHRRKAYDALRRARERRPIYVNVDMDFVRAALVNSGYDIHRVKPGPDVVH